MAVDQLEGIAPVSGDEFRPALGKLWLMLSFFLLMVPAGAVAALAWWFQVELPGGKVISTKAGIASLVAVPLGLLLSLVMGSLIVSAKRLVFGENCVQLLTGERVVVHIPYQNVAETYASGEAGAGVVGLKLNHRVDPGLRVPFWTKETYEIQVLMFREPLEAIHLKLLQRLVSFRARQR